MAYTGLKQNQIEVDANSCLRCHGKVFEAEKVQISAGAYHTYCLKCNECSKQLETSNFLEARDKNIYCAGCYAVKYGVKSRASSCGPLNLKNIPAMENDPDQCPRCKGKVFQNELVVMKSGHFHKRCFRYVFSNRNFLVYSIINT